MKHNYQGADMSTKSLTPTFVLRSKPWSQEEGVMLQMWKVARALSC